MRKKNGPSPDERSHSPVLPIEFIVQAQQVWQIPLMFYTWWWNEAVKMFWPHTPMMHHHASHTDEHDQLVVPEPIEEEGEHGLFA